MLRTTLHNRADLFRYVFWGFWFFLVPATLAYGAVTWLSASDLVGPLDDFAREQTVPAWIVAFTGFEWLLWLVRYRLPLAERFSLGGRSDLPVAVRQDYESATHLLEEADRVLGRHGPAIEQRMGAAKRQEVVVAVEALREAMKTQPFESGRFESAYASANELVTSRLSPWRKGEVREYAESIGVALIVALLLRALIVEAFKIPSGSMKPTLQIGDHIFVNKFEYGPKLPLLDRRVFSDLPPARGDVMVFEYPDINPRNERQDFIKRVIALPGDTLEVDSGHPIINGWRVPSCRVGKYVYDESDVLGPHSGELFVEYLGETAYLAVYDDNFYAQRQGPYRVAQGEVWVLGDNRHNSSDSRAWQRADGQRGAGVPFDSIKGRAMIVWWPPSRMLVHVMGEPQLPDGAAPELTAALERCLANRPPLDQTVPPAPRNAAGDSAALGASATQP
jgi:signal peptidase I